jgi:hypothetical protein
MSDSGKKDSRDGRELTVDRTVKLDQRASFGRGSEDGRSGVQVQKGSHAIQLCL